MVVGFNPFAFQHNRVQRKLFTQINGFYAKETKQSGTIVGF